MPCTLIVRGCIHRWYIKSLRKAPFIHCGTEKVQPVRKVIPDFFLPPSFECFSRPT